LGHRRHTEVVPGAVAVPGRGDGADLVPGPGGEAVQIGVVAPGDRHGRGVRGPVGELAMVVGAAPALPALAADHHPGRVVVGGVEGGGHQDLLDAGDPGVGEGGPVDVGVDLPGAPEIAVGPDVAGGLVAGGDGDASLARRHALVLELVLHALPHEVAGRG